jgi:hypothetical protein
MCPSKKYKFVRKKEKKLIFFCGGKIVVGTPGQPGHLDRAKRR